MASGSLPEPSAAKLAAVSSVDRHAAQLAELSDRIWAYAEIALREHKSAAALADFAEKQGLPAQQRKGLAGRHDAKAHRLQILTGEPGETILHPPPGDRLVWPGL